MKGKNFAIKQAKKLATKYFPRPEFVDNRNVGEIYLDLNKVSSDLNIKIVDFDFSNNFSGVFIRDNNSNFIGVNEGEVEERKRFTIAHEIGHFVLHSEDPLHYDKENLESPTVVMYRGNTPNNYNEVEANAFAAELLMPEELVDRCLQLGINSITELSKIFKVSDDAIRYRLINLHYI